MGFFLTIYTCSDAVVGVETLAIDFSAAGFDLPPVISASTIGEDNVNVFASNVTKSTATLNFSAKFTGRVTYIIRPSSQ
jgi:hypothetical protein